MQYRQEEKEDQEKGNGTQERGTPERPMKWMQAVKGKKSSTRWRVDRKRSMDSEGEPPFTS